MTPRNRKLCWLRPHNKLLYCLCCLTAPVTCSAEDDWLLWKKVINYLLDDEKKRDGDRQDAALISLFLYGLNACVSMHNINMPVKVLFITHEWFCHLCLPAQCSPKNQTIIPSFFSLTSLYFLPLQEAQSHLVFSKDIKKGRGPVGSGCFFLCFAWLRVVQPLAATIWNRDTEAGGIQRRHTRMKRRPCLKTEVEPAFRWGERHVEGREKISVWSYLPLDTTQTCCNSISSSNLAEQLKSVFMLREQSFIRFTKEDRDHTSDTCSILSLCQHCLFKAQH